MNGIVSTANELVDELEVDADGNFEVVLCAEERDGNWMRIEGAYAPDTPHRVELGWTGSLRRRCRPAWSTPVSK